ncbi:peptidyl-prolyl cis-trans isomerase [Novosphingobium marinum]|uniref:Peptidyl-prolyl cis-trans isomerase n=1 Tax=Novosphingobium marinum TaxID=1514948 RepID=A0A7Z0BVH6_9SPHN|nr:peptidylprolyl isomerase [Novosphingobium marinum]NYH95197.1 peptidylprolyl isomerase [Novosphingobium marinum]GGC25078.1 peptidyl-prolyl cis-trans isomerase [Novosphingobium marinum]
MADEYLTLTLDTGNGEGGDVKIKLRPDLAPNHVERIKELAGEGFYDGVKFHRVIDGFMAQGGCPHGTGTGGSEKPDLDAEFNAEPHTRGACSMARTSDPNSANSQFFIVFDDATFLDRQYTVWGNVEEGMEHVDALPQGEPPASPGTITRATVSEG